MHTVIRRAERQDYGAVERIMQQLQNLHVSLRPDIYRKADPVVGKAYFEQSADSGVWWVAETDGTVSGVMEIYRRKYDASVQTPRRTLFIASIAVEESLRSHGIGHALLKKAEELRDEAGMDGIELQVNARNAAARRLYESYGFRPESINMELIKEDPQ
ncbi:MAG: GNAT family N-acetyltransferase [Erysipelotrichaceae bacterium]|nr:GNAT family N-acetyltransferase [Erysipelotrichaceae bacterium]